MITKMIIIVTIINKTMYHKAQVNENNHVSIQHINLYKLSQITASIIKSTSILIVNCLQELINNLLNLQTRYPIATNKSYQNFITDIVKLKQKQFLGVNILIKRRLISFNKQTLLNLQKPMIRLPPQYFKVIPGNHVVAIKHVISHGG